LSSDNSFSVVEWGLAGDIPTAADFDGDGRTDRVVYRPDDQSSGLSKWYIFRSSDLSLDSIQWGLPGDTPAPADYDGDGRADIAVWRSSNQTFYSINSSNGLLQQPTLGQSGDKVVSSDYDGDGKADYAVYNSTTATWTIRNSATPAAPVTSVWGSAGASGCSGGSCSGEVPVQNDYDGDGKTDLATWRNSGGNWFIRQSGSNNSLRQVQWGIPADIPVPAFYRR
ncbi:MAG: FG-GAP repeat domain-containing protein, partial [Pyrinomonadaceae bacterium]